MAKLGSRKKPIILRVQTEQRATELSTICEDKGFQFIIGIEPDKEENIKDLNTALKPKNFHARLFGRTSI